jgi:hypothetical protein
MAIFIKRVSLTLCLLKTIKCKSDTLTPRKGNAFFQVLNPNSELVNLSDNLANAFNLEGVAEELCKT